MKLVYAIVSDDDSVVVSKTIDEKWLFCNKAGQYRRLSDVRKHDLHGLYGR